MNLNPFPASCLYESRGQQARPRLALALFIPVHWDGKLCRFDFFFNTDMPVRQGSHQMSARCLHGDAGDNTDDP